MCVLSSLSRTVRQYIIFSKKKQEIVRNLRAATQNYLRKPHALVYTIYGFREDQFMNKHEKSGLIEMLHEGYL